MRTKRLVIWSFCLMAFITLTAQECVSPPVQNRNVSDSGVKKARAKLDTGPDGYTVEQRNVKEYLEEQNTPGMIRHLYVISVYSGDVILYSPVDGKVTSSGKRLTSNMTLVRGDYGANRTGDFVMGRIGDDGTYGGANAAQYVYWKDTRGIFHKHFITGGQIIHVSGSPMAFPKVIMNIDPSWSDK